MPNREIKKYIEENIQKYPIPAIRLRLLRAGYRPADVDEALEDVEGLGQKEKGQIFKYKKEVSTLIISLIIIAGIAGFYFHKANQEIDCGAGVYLQDSHSCAFDIADTQDSLSGQTGTLCPRGATYNPQSGYCEMPITSIDCEKGTYNSATDTCEFTPLLKVSCPSPYYLEDGFCVHAPNPITICLNGTYNLERDRCEYSPRSVDLGCDLGYTLNRTTLKCEYKPEMTIICPDGTFNKVTGKCEVRPETISVCDTGTLNPSTGKCVIEPGIEIRCEKGIYNIQSDACESTPETRAVCPSGSVFNGENCVYTPSQVVVCSQGTYNASSERCELSPEMTPVCDRGVYQPASGRCEYQPEGEIVCPVGAYNSVSDSCEYAPESKAVCPANTILENGRCLFSPATVTICPEGTYNDLSGKCEITPDMIPICEEGIYDPADGKCKIQIASEIICDLGTYNRQRDVCEFRPEVLYLCEGGEIQEIDGEKRCVIKIDASEVCGDRQCGSLERTSGSCAADCEGTSYCGDGICGQSEEENGLCPYDCGPEEQVNSLSYTNVNVETDRINDLLYVADTGSDRIDIFDLATQRYGGSITLRDASLDLLRMFIDENDQIALLNSKSSDTFQILDLATKTVRCEISVGKDDVGWIDMRNKQVVRISATQFILYDYQCAKIKTLSKEGTIISKVSEGGHIGILREDDLQVSIQDLATGNLVDSFSVSSGSPGLPQHNLLLSDDWFVANFNREPKTDVVIYNRDSKQASWVPLQGSIALALKQVYLVKDRYFLGTKEDGMDKIIVIDLKDNRVFSTIIADDDTVAFTVDKEGSALYLLSNLGSIERIPVNSDVIDPSGATPLNFGAMLHLEGQLRIPDETEYLRVNSNLKQIIDLFSKYDAKITIESEMPYVEAADKWGDNLMLYALENGHGTGTHCDFDSMSLEQATASYRSRKEKIDSIVGADNNLGCSGGWGTHDWARASYDAGFSYLDGPVMIAYLAVPEENRPINPDTGKHYTDAEISPQSQEYYHDSIPPDMEDRIYPRRLKDTNDLIGDDSGIVLIPGSLGEIASLSEGRSSCYPGCQLTDEDIDVIMDTIDYVDLIRDDSKVATLNIHIPIDTINMPPTRKVENLRIIEDWLKRMQEYQSQGKIRWVTMKEVYEEFEAGGSNGDVPSPDTDTYEDSPFGIFASFSAIEYSYFNQRMGFDNDEYFDWADGHMENLGAHWTRSNLQLIWTMVEPEVGKGYVWDNAMMTDSMIKNMYGSPAEINWLGVFSGFGSPAAGKPSRDPLDYPEEYARFVQDTVERYDGDGLNDASPQVKVKYWQAGNEVMEWTKSGKTADEYLQLLILVNEAVKAADSEAKIVLIAPTDGKNIDPFIESVIEKASGQDLFDVIDVHSWGPSQLWKIDAVSGYQKLLDENGYGAAEIWSAEYGTWQGGPTGEFPVVQSELQQARFLVKGYVYNIKNGVDKIMWENLMEWNRFSGRNDTMFNSMGLISDGQGAGEDTGMFNKPRLSYYAYKLMTGMLEGSDWKTIETIRESDGIYIYKFTKDGRPIWVAWNENSIIKNVNVSVGSIATVEITEAVPKYESGKNVIDYGNAFTTGSGKISGGIVSLTLGSNPVYIKESSELLAGYAPTLYSQLQDQTPPAQGYCGDGLCSGPETNLICPADCISTTPPAQGYCGDGVCTGPETNVICPTDCKSTTPQPPTDGTTEQCIQTCIATGKTPQQCLPQCLCGDGICDSIEQQNDVCPQDCG